VSPRGSHARRAGGRGWAAPVLGVLAVAVLSLGVAGIVHDARPAGAAGLTDLRGNQVRLEPEVGAALPAASDATATDDRFVVASVGLDVPLGELSVVDGDVTPPDFGSAFRIRDEGVPLVAAETGTVFVVMHSLRGGGVAPGNLLIDVDTGSAEVAVGATIQVGARTYTVQGWDTVDKSRLAATSDVWAAVPGRLVVITCLQRVDGGPSVENMVITATLT